MTDDPRGAHDLPSPRRDSRFDLALGAGARVRHNLNVPELVEEAVVRREAQLASTGALVSDTGQFTGRSPKDKYIVVNSGSEGVDWGDVNQRVDQANFDRLLDDMSAHLVGKDLFVQDLSACADPAYATKVRVIAEYAWHGLFATNLFRDAVSPNQEPDWVVLDLPSFKADPARHGCRSTTAIMLDFERRLALVANTEYAGEIKKGLFTALNLELPRRDVFPMHCSANEGQDGAVTLFFGLSGTGKTTLSTDPSRRLIGDDEHGWSGTGVFNFEGGCYAKVVNLTEEAEPDIYAASSRFGTVLENVKLSGEREPDYADTSKTENTRAAYPISFVSNASPTGVGGHPRDIVFLSADAFGVLPPIARLTVPQALYYFLNGYTAKLAGTERGVTEPVATFSTCFGAPFMPLSPLEHAEMLRTRLAAHSPRVWMVNTGWTGGGFGVGKRISLRYTRAMLEAALSGALDEARTVEDGVFGLLVPQHVPNVPDSLLSPRGTWLDAATYDAEARRLAGMFRKNFERFAAEVAADVAAAGPRG